MADRVQAAHYPCECGASPPVVRLDAYTFRARCLCGVVRTLRWRYDQRPPAFAPDTERRPPWTTPSSPS